MPTLNVVFRSRPLPKIGVTPDADEFGRHICRFPVISNLFSDTPKIDPFTGMDVLERRGLRPRSQNRDVRVPETHRIRDVPFEERFSEAAVDAGHRAATTVLLPSEY